MKIFLSVLLVLISIMSLFLSVDDSAMAIYNENFDRAVYSFALAKGLNAIISVIQSSEIEVSFFVGVTVGFGEILDPLNDLIERFSWIMLASSVSIGIQHLLLLLGQSIFVKAILIVSIVVTLLGIWVKKLHHASALLFSIKLVFLLLVLRFGAIVFIYTTQMFYNQVYSEQYHSSTELIKEYKTDLEVIQKEKKGIESYLENFEHKMESFSEKVIKLITIFVVTTIIFPLLFLWFFIFLIKWVFNLKFDDSKVLSMLNKKNKK